MVGIESFPTTIAILITKGKADKIIQIVNDLELSAMITYDLMRSIERIKH